MFSQRICKRQQNYHICDTAGPGCKRLPALNQQRLRFSHGVFYYVTDQRKLLDQEASDVMGQQVLLKLPGRKQIAKLLKQKRRRVLTRGHELLNKGPNLIIAATLHTLVIQTLQQ